MKSGAPFRCDIFCHVVDNFGDIGVTWRLARQLHEEYGTQVRLIVDDLGSLNKIAPALDLNRDLQDLDGITVMRWATGITPTPAELVIEAFGCELPAGYITAMTGMSNQPVWLNLEYLSAESWIGSHHLLPSIHPSTGLRKHFFFPGFGANTGGLIRERTLFAERDNFFRRHALPPSGMNIFIFAYRNAALPALLSALKEHTGRNCQVACTFAPGVVADQARQSESELALGLELQFPPFVAQPDFDKVLWANDVLFIRGEDSLVRAQWAAKPFIWHIYPQEEGAHWAKLDAFLELYCEGLAGEAAAALKRLTVAWNAEDANDIAAAWRGFLGHLPALKDHAGRWAQQLAKTTDLASNLVTFYRKTAKI